MSEKIKITDTKSSNHCIVFLGENAQKPQTIFNAEIKCTPSAWYHKLLNSTPVGNYKIEVVIKENADCLHYDEQVLEVKVGTQSHSSVDFKVTQAITPFSLIFNPSKVTDGSTKKKLHRNADGNYSEDYTLGYDIIITDTDRGTVVYESKGNKLVVTLKLSATKALGYIAELVPFKDSKLKFSEQTDDGAEQPTEGDRWPKIAELKLRHATGYRCAPAAALTFKLEAIELIKPSVKEEKPIELDGTQITIGMEDDPKGRIRPVLNESHPVKARGSVVTSPDSKALQVIANRPHPYVVEGLYSCDEDGLVNVVTIPIHIDMAHLKNPLEDPGLIKLTVKHSPMRSDATTSLHADIPLYKNTSLVELKITVKYKLETGEEVSIEVSPTEDKTIKLPTFPLINQGSPDIDIVFENIAETTEPGRENAGIIVDGFGLSKVEDVPNEIPGKERIEMREGNNVESIFDYSGRGIHTLRCRKQYPGCERYATTLNYSLSNVQQIVRHPLPNGDYVYGALVQIHVSYRYLIDRFGSQVTKCEKAPEAFDTSNQGLKPPHRITFLVYLERVVTPGWLSLDFGTSAVVALYGMHDANSTTSLLALNKYRKEKFLPQAYQGDASKQRDINENSDYFLPSITYFNDHNAGDYRVCKEAADFDTSAIWFSPTTGMTVAAIEYQLPSMKLILGFDVLPDIFTSRVHNTFTYHVGDPDKPEPMVKYHLKYDNSNDLTEICGIDRLIEIIYHQLFQYYVQPMVDDIANSNHRPIEKIILTIPNTFTLQNVEMLRNLITRIIPSIRRDYIRFVSESDAVACYYLANEGQFPYAPERTKSFEEDLLVYDMGAGTLDLTYMHRVYTVTNEEQSQHITIVGKMGVSKAGNYLDHVIAQILVDLIKNSRPIGTIQAVESPEPSTRTQRSGDKEEDDVQAQPTSSRLTMSLDSDEDALEQSIPDFQSDSILSVTMNWDAVLSLSPEKRGIYTNQANDLKGYVSRQVKPILSEPADTPLPDFTLDKTYKVPFTVGDIVAHHLFTDYIQDATTKVLDRFAMMFSSVPDKLPVDTLIFSGRSTHLRQIREGVAHYLTDNAKNPKSANCHFADVGDMVNLDAKTLAPVLTEKSVNPKKISVDGLKTSVAQGALEYASYHGNGNQTFVIENRNIYANYGVLYGNINGLQYATLIDNHTKLSVDNQLGLEVYKSDEKFKLDFQSLGIRHIWLIQTYSDNPVRDWQEGNREMISVLFSCDCSSFVDHSKILLTIDKNNRLKFEIGGQNITVRAHVDFNDQSLKKSLWPVIFK